MESPDQALGWRVRLAVKGSADACQRNLLFRRYPKYIHVLVASEYRGEQCPHSLCEYPVLAGLASHAERNVRGSSILIRHLCKISNLDPSCTVKERDKFSLQFALRDPILLQDEINAANTQFFWRSLLWKLPHFLLVLNPPKHTRWRNLRNCHRRAGSRI
jgi:hypothetical protein